jgi:PBP4 family serine-type D-alanyl-D-alanine carboxypeptidase
LRIIRLCIIAALLIVPNWGAADAQSDTLESRVQRIMARPEFAHSNFGIEFFDPDADRVIYSVNPEKLFVPASTTKLLTEGTVLAKLGPDYRFHTFVYRTGPIDKHGTLKGDIILVASGDPNLSNRIQPDGNLAFIDEDHSYQGPALPGDPLIIIKDFARQIAAKGIRKIQGNVFVDASLMPDGAHEGGTDVVMSSIIVNDNLIDLVCKAGGKAGDPVELSISPQSSYIHFSNKIITGAPNSRLDLESSDPVANPDGSINIVLSGNVAAGSPTHTAALPVPSPTQFATMSLRDAVRAAGIEIKSEKSKNTLTDPAPYKRFYTAENQVAEHISPPLSEDIRITLKVSQNLHAGMGPYYLGLLVAKDTKDPLRAGFKIEHSFLTDAKLDLTGASQGDGAGGDWADLFSPDFICHYLAYWKTRPDFPIFFAGLPVLGKDGTLATIQVKSPAAGHVFAKTGTFDAEDRLNGRRMLAGKGLGGYVKTKSGRTLVFAAYVNHTSLPDEPEIIQKVAGEALGEIAASAYDVELGK